MGKKSKKGGKEISEAEQTKEDGNKAFLAKEYFQAIELYSKAI
jgi:hypothetical protein